MRIIGEISVSREDENLLRMSDERTKVIICYILSQQSKIQA
jgi:hypothetical protein